MSLERFTVTLDNPSSTFSPGEVVSGLIFVDVRRRKTVRGLKVRVKGTAQVRWSESSGTGSDRKTVYYTGDEEYFRMEFYVLGHSGDGNVDIEGGSHTYPFKFVLPRNIPSSFESEHGSIRYSIKAIMDRPWKFDHERTLPFTVETPFDLNQSPDTMTPISDDDYSTLCCFSCFNMGVVKVNVFLPSSGFAVGEAIEATVNINNTSTSVDVEKIKLKLEQKIKCYARFPSHKTKKHTDIVQKADKPGPFNKTDEVVVGMQVPSLPDSDLPHCGIIDVDYKLKVIVVVSGCHQNIEMVYPIKIGRRPALAAQQTIPYSVETTAPVPTAPFVSDVPPPVPGDAMPMPMPMSTDAMSMPMPTDSMPMPMPMPAAMPMPYMPSHGEKNPENTSQFNPAPGFPTAGFAPVNNTPYPMGHTPYPTGNTPYPTGNTPYPTGSTPYPPAMPGPIGFVPQNAAQTNYSAEPTAPPSYNEAMGMTKKK